MARKSTRNRFLKPEKITWKPYAWMTKMSNWMHFWRFGATGGIGIWRESDDYTGKPVYVVVVRDYADSVAYESEQHSLYREALAEARYLKSDLNTMTKFDAFLRKHGGYAGD